MVIGFIRFWSRLLQVDQYCEQCYLFLDDQINLHSRLFFQVAVQIFTLPFHHFHYLFLPMAAPSQLIFHQEAIFRFISNELVY